MTKHEKYEEKALPPLSQRKTPTVSQNKETYEVCQAQQLRARRHIHRHREVRLLAGHQLPQLLPRRVLRQRRAVSVRDPFPFRRVDWCVCERNGGRGGLVLGDEAFDGVGDVGGEFVVLHEDVHDVAEGESRVQLQPIPAGKKED